MSISAGPHDEEHLGMSRQYWRDIVLGVNDGLVSMLLLMAGVVGGGLASSQVWLAGVAGAVAGAVSMAAGEYLATKSQEEVLSAELEVEERHIRLHRPLEVAQLRHMLAAMAVAPDDLDAVVEALSRRDYTLLQAMKALEFGVVDSERRSPYLAMATSGLLFLLGAAAPVLPFLVAPSPQSGLLWASILTALALFGVGMVKARVTRGRAVAAGLENLAIAGVGGVAAYAVGGWVGGG